jgi:hypothetical protein
MIDTHPQYRDAQSAKILLELITEYVSLPFRLNESNIASLGDSTPGIISVVARFL